MLAVLDYLNMFNNKVKSVISNKITEQNDVYAYDVISCNLG